MLRNSLPPLFLLFLMMMIVNATGYGMNPLLMEQTELPIVLTKIRQRNYNCESGVVKEMSGRDIQKESLRIMKSLGDSIRTPNLHEWILVFVVRSLRGSVQAEVMGLLDDYINFKVDGYPALFEAVRLEQFEAMKLLLRKEEDEKHSPFLCWLVEERLLRALYALREEPIIYTHGHKAYTAASEKGYVFVKRIFQPLLVEEEVLPMIVEVTPTDPMIQLRRKPHYLQHIHQVDIGGITGMPDHYFHDAVEMEARRIVALLEPYFQDHQKHEEILVFVVQHLHGFVQCCVLVLISMEEHIDCKRDGYPALFAAARLNQHDAMIILMEEQDPSKHSPFLCWLVDSGRIKALYAIKDLQMTREYGKLAFKMAAVKRHSFMKEILRPQNDEDQLAEMIVAVAGEYPSQEADTIPHFLQHIEQSNYDKISGKVKELCNTAAEDEARRILGLMDESLEDSYNHEEILVFIVQHLRGLVQQCVLVLLALQEKVSLAYKGTSATYVAAQMKQFEALRILLNQLSPAKVSDFLYWLVDESNVQALAAIRYESPTRAYGEQAYELAVSLGYVYMSLILKPYKPTDHLCAAEQSVNPEQEFSSEEDDELIPEARYIAYSV